MRFSQASGTFVILQLQIAVPEGAEGCKYPPAEPVALRLLASQRGLTATVRSKSKNKSKGSMPH
jgi:hypothetical protein